MRDEGEDLCEGHFKFKPKRLFNIPLKAAAPFAFSHPSVRTRPPCLCWYKFERRDSGRPHMSRSLLQMTAASSHMTCCRRLRLVADAVCFLTDRSEGLLNAQMNHAACLIQSPRVLQHACMCVTVSCHATSGPISPQPTQKRSHNTDYLYPTVWNYINSLGCRCSVVFFYLPCLT